MLSFLSLALETVSDLIFGGPFLILAGLAGIASLFVLPLLHLANLLGV